MITKTNMENFVYISVIVTDINLSQLIKSVNRILKNFYLFLSFCIIQTIVYAVWLQFYLDLSLTAICEAFKPAPVWIYIFHTCHRNKQYAPQPRH